MAESDPEPSAIDKFRFLRNTPLHPDDLGSVLNLQTEYREAAKKGDISAVSAARTKLDDLYRQNGGPSSTERNREEWSESEKQKRKAAATMASAQGTATANDEADANDGATADSTGELRIEDRMSNRLTSLQFFQFDEAPVK